MASNGIRDRVAIIGMGCTPFGEHWDKSASDLLVDATGEALNSAGVDLKDIDAFWLGTLFSGSSGLTLSRPLKIDYKPVSRLENYCATGSESLRQACGRAIVPIQLPIGEERDFKGVVDLVSMKAYTFASDGSGKMTEGAVPADMTDAANAAREALIEMVAEADERLMEKFFDAGTLTQDELIGGLKIRIGDLQVDASIQTELETIRSEILSRSTHEIQSRRDRFSPANGN